MGFFLAALLGGFLFFNTQATPGRAERAAEEALRRHFPGAQAQVDIEGRRGFDVLHGKFKRVRLTLAHFDAGQTGVPLAAAGAAKERGHIGRFELRLRDFTLDGLKIAAADLDFDDVDFDWQALKQEQGLQIAGCGPAHARLVLRALPLETLAAQRLGQRFPDARDLRLELEAGRVRVRGKKSAPWVGVGVPFTLTARPEVRRGNEIWLVEPRLGLSPRLPVTVPANALLRSINPVYVFDPGRQWPVRVQVTGVQADGGTLELNADLALTPPVTALASAP